MENKWTALSESLPPDSNDVMIKSTEWETEYNELGIRIGFLGYWDKIVTACWDNRRDEYVNEIIKITPDTAKQIKWKLIE